MAGRRTFLTEAHQNNFYEFSPYLKENINLHNYEHELDNAV
jgi:hypothetical protein